MAVHFQAAFAAACNARHPAVGKMSELAERLQAAGQEASDLRACIAGAMLEAFEAGHATCKESFRLDAQSKVDGLIAELRRQVGYVLDQAASKPR